MEQWFNQFQGGININPLFLMALSLWSLIWKSLALWRASRNNQLHWFVALLVLNTVGVAEIVYLKFFQAKRTDKRSWPMDIDKFFKRFSSPK
ncbi:MAG: DUF5652 family protein [bacterium]|nr:DUF5652 family protein [bacterium]